MKKIFLAIIVGPEGYVEGGFKLEWLTITEEHVSDYLSEGEGSLDDAVEYYKREYIAEWGQRMCQCILLSEEQAKQIKPFIKTLEE